MKQHVRRTLIPNLVLIFLLTPIVLLGNFLNELNDVDTGSVIIDSSFNTIIAEYVSNEVIDNTINKILLSERPDIDTMVGDITDTYMDMSILKTDLNNGNETSPIYSIFRKYLDNTNDKLSFMNTFICMNDQIILDLKKYKDGSRNTWDHLIGNLPNDSLSTNAINDITNVNKTFCIWQTKEDSRINDLTYIDKTVVHDLVSEYGIDILKSLNGLVILYITDDGDIFGTNDINNIGERQSNYKIMIVNEFNLYEAFEYISNSSYTFNNINSSYNKISLYLKFYKKERSKTLVFIGILFLFSAIALMTVQNQKIIISEYDNTSKNK